MKWLPGSARPDGQCDSVAGTGCDEACEWQGSSLGGCHVATNDRALELGLESSDLAGCDGSRALDRLDRRR